MGLSLSEPDPPSKTVAVAKDRPNEEWFCMTALVLDSARCRRDLFHGFPGGSAAQHPIVGLDQRCTPSYANPDDSLRN